MTAEAPRAPVPSINSIQPSEDESLSFKALARMRAHSVTETARLESSWAMVGTVSSIK